LAAVLIGLIIGLPWTGALLVWWVGDNHPRAQHATAVVFAAAAALAAMALLPFKSVEAALTLPLGGAFGNFTFNADGMGVFLAVVAAVIGCLAVVFSLDYMRGETQLGRYYAFILFFIGGMCGLVLTTNLFLLFVFWEITALTSYGLISFYNDNPIAAEGGLKALIITQLGGVGLLAGALLVYAFVGTFEMAAFFKSAATLQPGVLSIMAFGFLLAAAAKSAQFPFQTWLPGAMEAPTPVSALIHAATMVNAGVYLLARFYPVFASVHGWKVAVMTVGVLSALLAAVMALTSYDLKQVLAYSTVSQLGFMVYAVGTGGIFASQFHLLSHAIFKALLFLSAGAVIHAVGTRDMRKMGGLGRQMPFVRAVFGIGALALVGMPVLNGFWSKELILEVGWKDGPIWLFVPMLITVGLTALYTFRCMVMVFYGQPVEPLHGHDAGPAMRVALIPLALGALLSWLLAGEFGHFLSVSLPAHKLDPLSLSAFLLETLKAPVTWVGFGVTLLGLALWWWRAKLAFLNPVLRPIVWASQRSFGFEKINQIIALTVTSAAEDLRFMQTGLLNWNILAIFGGLLFVIAFLALVK
jgi:NADH-quinone oxidoreductase subunit L